MRLLDRYLLRELLIPLCYCLSGFLLFWISADMISTLDDFRAEGLGMGNIALYYLLKAPESLMVVMPIALLLALLYALTNHARHHELTAIRAAGISLWRLSFPYLGVGLLFSLLVYFLNEKWLPNSSSVAEQIRRGQQLAEATGAGRSWTYDLKFWNEQADRLWRIRAYNVDTGEMKDPFVDWRLRDGSRCQLLAEKAVRKNGIWRFHNVRVLIPGDLNTARPFQQHAVLPMPEFAETPEMIHSQVKISQLSSVRAARKVRLTISEILHYRHLHPDMRPADRAMLDTQLHARLAAPWTCLVVVLIAVPFAAPSGRRNVFVGVSCSIFICFLYYLVQQFSMGFGTAGKFSPVLAAWLPNLVFGLTGIILMSRVR